MAAEEGLDVGAAAGADRIELGDNFPSADDREVLAAMLYGVKNVGEVPGCIGGADLWHGIRLSDRTRPERQRTRLSVPPDQPPRAGIVNSILLATPEPSMMAVQKEMAVRGMGRVLKAGGVPDDYLKTPHTVFQDGQWGTRGTPPAYTRRWRKSRAVSS